MRDDSDWDLPRATRRVSRVQCFLCHLETKHVRALVLGTQAMDVHSPRTSTQSPSYCLSQDDAFQTCLAFDPSVTFVDLEVHIRRVFPAQQGITIAHYRSVTLTID